MIPKALWKNSILDRLLEWYDEEERCLLWCGGHPKGYISSETEMYCSLFDDYNFGDFVQRLIITPEERDIIHAFIKAAHAENPLRFEDTLGPEWQEIGLRAKAVSNIIARSDFVYDFPDDTDQQT